MSKKTKKTMGRGKKFLVGLGVVVLLIALFFVSFWVTTLSLRANREPSISTETGAPTATAAPEVNYKKLSKKELIELLEEKDELIEELNKELGRGSLSTQAPIDDTYSKSNISEETDKPKATEKPAAKATEKPSTAKVTPKPVATKAPAPKATVAPKPVEKPAPPTEAPAADTTAKAPSIKPVAPAADSE